MMSVYDLRKNGFKVRVNHYRCTNNFGGATVVDVTHPLGKTFTGTSLCNYQDQFNRKLGLRIALGRALKQFGYETK